MMSDTASSLSLMVTIPEVVFLGMGVVVRCWISIVHALMKDTCICVLHLVFYEHFVFIINCLSLSCLNNLIAQDLS